MYFLSKTDLVLPVYGKCSPYNLTGKASPMRQIIIAITKHWSSHFSSNNGVNIYPGDMYLTSDSQTSRDRVCRREGGRDGGKGGWIDERNGWMSGWMDRWLDGEACCLDEMKYLPFQYFSWKPTG